jgi:chemotaxis protein methyltransferase CheR
MTDSLDALLHSVATWTGIDLSRDGRTGAFRQFVTGRMQALCLPSIAAYADRLTWPDGPETRRLVAAITVGHTWFYRDPAQMEQIATIIKQGTNQGHSGSETDPRRPSLQIWVPGCASGEDAYTLAMLALFAGRPASVLGTDISETAIARAHAGRYDPAAAAELPPPFLAHLLPRPDQQVEVAPALREQVRFVRHNLLDPPPTPIEGTGFHLILCRNVLIYFAPEQALATVERLGRALLPGGWLFLGASEVLRAVPPELSLVSLSGRYALRRLPAPVSPGPTTPRPRADTGDLLRRARDRFRDGDYPGALLAYGDVLRHTPACAEALLFTGIALHLSNDPSSAERALRGALSVASGLWPASFYLGLCYEKLGMPAAAQQAYQHVIKSDPCPHLLDGADALLGDLVAWRREVIDVSRQRLRAWDGRRHNLPLSSPYGDTE